MRRNIFLILAIILIILTAIFIHHRTNTFEGNIESALNSHFNKYKDLEYFSGIALSIYKPNQEIKTFTTGKISHEKTSRDIGTDTLFEIGSITKSFTAAIILQLQKENKIQLSDTIGKWLPEYKKWSDLKIDSLLNMTSGLPNYTDAPLMNTAVSLHPQQTFTDKELINFVYPAGDFVPPLRSGYYYTNTGYILLSMMIERITQNSFKTEIENRLIKPANLRDTFYPVPAMDKQVLERLAHGYGYNPYSNPEQIGVDTSHDSLSWAAAAGGLVATTSDIIKWVQTLFVDTVILDQQQKNSMMQMVSTSTGKPITALSGTDAAGFALGITQAFDKEIGNFWFYEGETEGFRALYMYVPENGIIISAAFNSAVNQENDHSGELMKAVYKIMRKSH